MPLREFLFNQVVSTYIELSNSPKSLTSLKTATLLQGISDTDGVCIRAGELAQQSGELAAFTEDLDLVPSTHISQLTIPFNSNSGGSDAFFLPVQVPTHTHTREYLHTGTYI